MLQHRRSPKFKTLKKGLHINLIQKYYRKFEQGNLTKFTHIFGRMLPHAGNPSLQDHMNTIGPGEWLKTGTQE
jgi:hypothetical protein